MDFIMGGRACGKTTFLREQALKAVERGENVQVLVADAQRARLWEEWLHETAKGDPFPVEGTIEIVIPSDFNPNWRRSSTRFIDDAEEVLSQLTNGYDLAVANGRLYGFFNGSTVAVVPPTQ